MLPNDQEFKRHLISFIKNLTATFRTLRFQSSREGISHGAIVSHSTYSPWLDDAVFQQVWPRISEHSLLDIYRMFQLWELTGQVCRNPKLSGAILEVGSWRGGSGCLIAHRANLAGVKCPVYLADTFTGVTKTGAADTLYRGGEHSDTSPDIVRNLAQQLSLQTVELLIGIFPEDTGDSVRDQTFRLCHIDVDAYQSGKDVFDWVWPRLETGGMVVFDDYGFWGCEGMTTLVNELKLTTDGVFIHNLTGQAIFIKTSGA